MTSNDKTVTNQTAERFADRAGAFGDILDATGGQWTAPTPCEGWTVRDVVAHVIETERDFIEKQGLDVGPAPLTDPVQAWRTHSAHLIAVLGQDGVAERDYDGYFGRTTIGDTIADFYGWDLMIHGWDVARATGQEWHISEEEAARLEATAIGWGEALYSEGVCAPALSVPDDATGTDRLLAMLGRDPAWRA